MSVLVGKNNVGKTNILKAIDLAFSYTSISKEDVYSSISDPFDESKIPSIDILIRPFENGSVQSDFDSDWGLYFGKNITIESSSGRNLVAFRTELRYDSTRHYYVNKKNKIKEWKLDGNHKLDTALPSSFFDNIQCVFINAQRDISIDLQDRKSIWGKMISKIDINPDSKSKITKQLANIGERIVNDSDLLKVIQKELKNSTADEAYSVDISPITRELESLYKGMDIYYTNENYNPTSVSNLGLGVRSWAVFSTLKAQIHNSITTIIPFHSILLVEEPEAHVHPQAQRQLYEILCQIPFQKIVTTHSPYIVSEALVESISLIQKNSNTTFINAIGSNFALSHSEIININEKILGLKGEILFSRIVIFVEGITELYSIPQYYKEYFGVSPISHGVSFVSADCDEYKDFINFACSFKLKWYIAGDGEQAVKNKLIKAMEKVTSTSLTDLSGFPNIILIPLGKNIEQYLISLGYLKEINRVIDSLESKHTYIKNHYMTNNNWTKYKTGNHLNYPTSNDEYLAAMAQYMKRHKTDIARPLAKEIIGNKRKSKRIPPIYIDLFNKIKGDLGV
jgi:putative ATP-dependent endonuclease of OLD family